MGEVVHLEVTTTSEEPVVPFLDKVKTWEWDDGSTVLVIGMTGGGDLMIGGTVVELPDILFMLELAKKKLLEDHL